MLPGPDVQIVDQAAPAGALSDTGNAFMVGLADRGLAVGPITAAMAVTSLADFVAKWGARQSYSVLYDAVESFFAEGGSRVYISRIVGPGAAKATAAVPASTPKFTAVAKSYGSWGNNLAVAVASSVITVKENGVVVETSPVLADVTAAQAWSTGSQYIDITPVGTGALTDSADRQLGSGISGTDDRANITDTQRQAALDRFSTTLGPGQVLMPGDTRTQAHAMLAAHALATNRFALCDAPDTPTAATILAVAATGRSLGKDQARHVQILAPWLTVPGTTTGTSRTVPPSAVQAGMYARNDASTGNPNQAAAGLKGISRFATAVSNTYSDAARNSLADAGVTVLVAGDQGVMTYDDVTLVDPLVDPEWLGAANNREVMALANDALGVASAHLFAQTSGIVDLNAFAGDLKGVCLRHRVRGSLFGDTPEDAFRVEAGPTVNTLASLQQRKLLASIGVKLSPSARQVIVQIANVPLTAAI